MVAGLTETMAVEGVGLLSGLGGPGSRVFLLLVNGYDVSEIPDPVSFASSWMFLSGVMFYLPVALDT